MEISTLITVGMLSVVISLAVLIAKTYHDVSLRRDRAATLTNTLLMRLAKEAPNALIRDVSYHCDGPSMRRLAMRTPGFDYTFLTPLNWEMSDPELPRPLCVIEGTVIDVGDISSRKALLSHPLWERDDVSSFSFQIGVDPSEDAELRTRHGLLYDLVAKNGKGEVVAHADGILNRDRLAGHMHHDSIARIAKAAQKHIDAAVDSEGGVG